MTDNTKIPKRQFRWRRRSMTYEIFWGDTSLTIQYSNIETQAQLLQWIAYLCESSSSLPNMSPARLAEWIRDVQERRGWSPFDETE